jgi:hypothetical protein
MVPRHSVLKKMANVGSTVVVHSTNNPEVEGSNPTGGTERDKMTKKFKTMNTFPAEF